MERPAHGDAIARRENLPRKERVAGEVGALLQCVEERDARLHQQAGVRRESRRRDAPDHLTPDRRAEEQRIAGKAKAPRTTQEPRDADDPKMIKKFADANRDNIAEDHSGATVFLARNEWQLNRAKQDYAQLRFLQNREQAPLTLASA